MQNKQSTYAPVIASVKTSLKTHPGAVLLLVALIVASVVTSLLPPLVLKRVINELTAGKGISFRLSAGYLLLVIVSDLFETAQNSAITIFGQKITHGIRSVLCAKLDRLPADYFTKHPAGQITSVFVNDADTIDTLYSDGIVGMLADSFKLIGILGIIFTECPGLAILLVILTPFLFLLTRHFQRATLVAQRDNRQAIGRVSNHVPETIRNIRMIHVLGKEKYMESRYDAYISDSYNAVNRSNFYDGIYSPIIQIVQAAVVAVMMVAAVSGLELQGLFGLSVGSAVAVISYVGKLFAPIENIGMELQNIQTAIAGIRHISDFLNVPDRVVPEAEKPEENAPAVVFDQVTFGYDPSLPILKQLSFTIAPGEHVFILGRSGAGKSTIFKLLLGLYQPQGGAIRLFGENPQAIPDAAKRRVYGCVEQDFQAIQGNLRDQIALFDPAITDEEIWAALRLSRLEAVVRALPEQLDTPMSSGLFSRGQLQLLSIARAVVTSPRLLLLDEITANLDSETEQNILEALEAAAEGRTVLSISHRLSAVMNDKRKIHLN
ncbi:ABC transporter ATP-binding protein/permease [Acidaminococcus sp. NSJ-142]|jgi:ATP-binding cassette subfamily B protein|uniref:ABC transporter ATP-binding protein n=1 Tax=Acidaminococcus TaxID=904 RepID=UPI000CFA7F2F|nr:MULTISPECIES: ABC transporter ATP-binding protein [Acidaminococcus]MCD2434712.1 ABC transporter ATP-binding protein/permease [Acidaminococcus hominis]MCH4095349.1 ABC transporter ATP-binding protein/permease [Acidaminococcus provencensis]